MLQLVKIRLRKSTRVVPFLARDLAIERGDACIVRTERGLEYGACVAPPEECLEDTPQKPDQTIVRKANYNDENTHQQLFLEEEKAKTLCLGEIERHRLPMRLVDVEYTFDKRKVVFYFTAEERVDFRDLVRDLAHDLKMRIELRHIQVRDKSKLVGGLAACGRELCCATWMGDFMPISMKMAKRQNLSLNPSKISGQCGRLMCCLSYENDQYPSKRKKQVIGDDMAPPPFLGDEEAEETAPGRKIEIEDEEALDKAILVARADGREDLGEETDDDADEATAPEGEGGDTEDKKPRKRSRKRRRRKRPGGGTGASEGPAGDPPQTERT